MGAAAVAGGAVIPCDAGNTAKTVATAVTLPAAAKTTTTTSTVAGGAARAVARRPNP